MIYLIYDNEEDANARADIEGQRVGHSHWTEGKGTRWVTAPVLTVNGKYALNVTTYDLTEEEKSNTVNSYNPAPIEEI
tara:strand:- start:72 stop:305 length:234 start_codon:yes stop_codon:yes gene_type:complete